MKRQLINVPGILCIAILLLCSCARTSTPNPQLGFVTQLGEHVIDGDSRILSIFEESGGINYRFKAGMAKWGPSVAPIKKDAKWFAFVETVDRVWIHDGDKNLTLLRRTNEGNGSYSIQVCGDWLIKEIPTEVRERIPHILNTEPTVGGDGTPAPQP
jgi:hypothetical protein